MNLAVDGSSQLVILLALDGLTLDDVTLNKLTRDELPLDDLSLLGQGLSSIGSQ